MKQKILVILVFLMSSMALQGCAHRELSSKIDREVSQESAIKSHSDLRSETSQLIDSSPNLTAEQRLQLSALAKSVRTRSDLLWSESLKLRSVLIKDLLAADYDEDEVELIKRRIKSVESQRLSVTFDAIEKAKLILGKEAVANAHLFDVLFEGRGGRE
jgi:hypothetical protein